MRTAILCLVTALTLCVALDPETAAAQETAHERQKTARSLVTLLAAGVVKKVSSLLHYPASYTRNERAEDEAGVAKQLAFLLNRFGTISGVVLADQEIASIDFGVGGGTPAYFSSLGTYETIDIAYSANFEREGAGLVKVSFLKVVDGWHPFKISLGLPLSRPDARALMEQLARALAAHMAGPEVAL